MGINANGRRAGKSLRFAALVVSVLAGMAIFLHLIGTKPIYPSEIPAQIEEEAIVTMTATWKDEDNITHEVVTTREEEETQADFTARHKAAVLSLKAEFPPV